MYHGIMVQVQVTNGGYAKLIFTVKTTNSTQITTSKLNVESILNTTKGISLNNGPNNIVSRPQLTSSIIAPYEIREEV